MNSNNIETSLSKKEEELMDFIWQSGKPFLKDIIECYPDPKPATTTIATLLKRLQDKGVIDYEMFGNSRRYFPLIKKDAYFSNQMSGMIKQFFNDSALQFASFFTTSSNLSDKELESLRKIVDQELKKRKDD
ncbi:BlaI/MecI/CopY family transcriptional regulator [Sphingobacterium spiritivorum]|uniref:BlaI/MecI/CopY family transcriptional regulator n=1 Tax=Sphingobacterium spiritivorum TaxID=258 RepID=UPI00191B2A7E|nr:BlaI/MecI/CopY family transcriptional regulator [Sphingobacterium spiritivorum]QQT26890.1 BlaI/MecI/CopY family transcriptional regulator [Sphingobacterium spiritivorum]